MGRSRVRGRWRRWWPGSWARHRGTPKRSPRWRTGLRSFRAAPRACGRVDCRWIRSGSSPGGRPRDPMSIMRSWPRSPRSTSCAPRSSWNRDPNPTLGPSRSASITKTSDEHGSAATGSRFRLWRRRSSMRRWRLIVMRCSPSGNAITTTVTHASDQRPPLPNTTGDAFMRLVDAGWDAEAARRPHGQHTTVVVHLDVKERARGAASGSAAVRR